MLLNWLGYWPNVWTNAHLETAQARHPSSQGMCTRPVSSHMPVFLNPHLLPSTWTQHMLQHSCTHEYNQINLVIGRQKSCLTYLYFHFLSNLPETLELPSGFKSAASPSVRVSTSSLNVISSGPTPQGTSNE